MMDITIEQARVLEAVARLGTIQKAALELHRGHSAVVYSLKCLEDQTRLSLFDRRGHRNRLSVEGEVVLKFCRRLLETRAELAEACHRIKEGWEPSLKLIYDEVIDFNLIGAALFRLNEMDPPTEVKVLSAHLDEVENLFHAENAGLMVTILPFPKSLMPSRPLRPIQMQLVAHRDHALAAKARKSLGLADLNRHSFITIKASSGHLGLGTDGIKFDSYFYVNGFMMKKQAIMNRLGFGWLPDYLIRAELKTGKLVRLPTEMENKVAVVPKLYHRPEATLGRAARGLVRFLQP